MMEMFSNLSTRSLAMKIYFNLSGGKAITLKNFLDFVDGKMVSAINNLIFKLERFFGQA